MQRLTSVLWHFLERWISLRGLGLQTTANGVRNAQDPTTPALFDDPGLKFLHVGCGSDRKPSVGRGFLGSEWREIRADINPAAQPDVIASMTSMPSVPEASVDAVYSSHNIEHLYPHEVPVALGEFFRVLKPQGFLVLGCPDLQTLSQFIHEDKLDETLYVSPAGPVAPLDVLYGFRPDLARGNLFMAHRTGFTLKTLVASVRSSGFRAVLGCRREAHLDLWVVASKALLSEPDIRALADSHLP